MNSTPSRREVLAGAMAGSAGLMFNPKLGRVIQAGPKLVTVPEQLDSAVFLSEGAGISRRTHEAHLALWQGYARKVNEIRQLLTDQSATTAPNQIYSQMRSLKANYAFAWGGYINHKVYFAGFGEPEKGQPGRYTIELIEGSYGSIENWKTDLKATAIAARGWVYVAVDPEVDRIFNFLGDSQDTYPAWGHSLVLACDVYEHAYFLDFGTDRGKYVDAWLKCIDWGKLENRIKDALNVD